MFNREGVAAFWGRKALRTGETCPFHPDAPEHREFVFARMRAREIEAARAAVTQETKCPK